MNLTSRHPFCSVKNGLPENYPSLQRDVVCDAVVIGGGITGALVAVHLVEAGVRTLLLDKREHRAAAIRDRCSAAGADSEHWPGRGDPQLPAGSRGNWHTGTARRALED